MRHLFIYLSWNTYYSCMYPKQPITMLTETRKQYSIQSASGTFQSRIQIIYHIPTSKPDPGCGPSQLGGGPPYFR